jgi:hypothetical protein
MVGKREVILRPNTDTYRRTSRKTVPAQPVDATPSDKSFLFIGGVYDRRKTG